MSLQTWCRTRFINVWVWKVGWRYDHVMSLSGTASTPMYFHRVSKVLVGLLPPHFQVKRHAMCWDPGPLFTKKTLPCGYRNPHYKSETSQVYNGNPPIPIRRCLLEYSEKRPRVAAVGQRGLRTCSGFGVHWHKKSSDVWHFSLCVLSVTAMTPKPMVLRGTDRQHFALLAECLSFNASTSQFIKSGRVIQAFWNVLSESSRVCYVHSWDLSTKQDTATSLHITKLPYSLTEKYWTHSK